ncbi:hypothetical protein [Singulisphaera sp. PoT]|uniref:hypothetical protein n=1 Tax=Singulisphaera sp. PoT TaxID=3411797 RepID=UPI003BF540AB
MSDPDLVITGLCLAGGMAVVLMALGASRVRRPSRQVRLDDDDFARRYPRLWRRMRAAGLGSDEGPWRLRG